MPPARALVSAVATTTATTPTTATPTAPAAALGGSPGLGSSAVRAVPAMRIGR
ncbi:hypothetical protein [Streptomyces sp. NPDC018000]|uniref:hypothetical protein n=1 Tax=Streptomyces sp. NPDC018000 TaxID=3365028 RepID=UPI0037B5173E